MTPFKRATLAVLLGLSIGGTAQAADGDIGPPMGQSFGPFHEGDNAEHRPRWSAGEEYRGGWRGNWGGNSYGRAFRPHWGRPVAERHWWGGRDDCRLIVKRRLTPWGDVRVKRIEICD
jgi:hypothetical protein